MQIRHGLDVDAEAIASICRRYRVRRLELFGSSARGDHREDSDVDLLVEFDPASVPGLLAFGALQAELEDLLNLKVDLVSRGGLERSLRDEILGAARLVFAG